MDLVTGTTRHPKIACGSRFYKEDDEAARIWTGNGHRSGRGAPGWREPGRISVMGETGHAAPCSEIFYDHGTEIAGGRKHSDEDGDRYVKSGTSCE